VYGQPSAIVKTTHPPAGYFLQQLMLGVNEFSVSSGQGLGFVAAPRKLPAHVHVPGLVHPNGTWYSQDELACITSAVPPTPAVPAGPGKPVALYNVSGLSVRHIDG